MDQLMRELLRIEIDGHPIYDPVKGDLMPKYEAAEKAGISPDTINNYIEKGYLERINGPRRAIHVYYRDLLRASWRAYSEGNTRRMPGIPNGESGDD